ncbi:hypothetical protein BH24ACI1_BH24ACI1_01970 [soil metagenome]|jgi:septal ring factor EnvC (AmiA/AmiB activator)
MKYSFPELPDDLQGQIASLQTALISLVNDSLETNTKIDKLSERINDLQVLQKQTDERLNAATLMVEKFFSGENGNSKKKK